MPLRALAAAAAGDGCLYLLAISQSASHLSLVIPPFGASCVLVFLLPESPLAQLKNVIGGHVIATVMGLIALALFGGEIALTQMSDSVSCFWPAHPWPEAENRCGIFLTQPC